LETKVLTKIAHLDREGNICMCDKQFYKVCPIRVKNDLPCEEYLISFTLRSVENTDREEQTIFTGPNMFQDTLEHLGRLL
jgi:hypothetical protein